MLIYNFQYNNKFLEKKPKSIITTGRKIHSEEKLKVLDVYYTVNWKGHKLCYLSNEATYPQIVLIKKQTENTQVGIYTWNRS